MQHQFRPNLSASAISVFSYCLESNLLHETVLRNCFFSLEYQETLFQRTLHYSLKELKVAYIILEVVYATVESA